MTAITDEPESERVWAWLRAAAAGSLFVSPWVTTEVSSALSIKVRTGRIAAGQAVAALEEWQRWRDTSVLSLGIRDNHFTTAAAFADRHELKLRAGDALHLAVAADAGCAIVTLDRALAEAAPHVGVPAATF